MADIIVSLTWAGSMLGAVVIVSVTALKAWRGWIDLRREEMKAECRLFEGREGAPAARIEMADLKERLRKLEAIARGVDP